MALPAQLSTISARNRYTKDDGTAETGTVTFVPTIRSLQIPAADTTVTVNAVTATLDTNGQITADLIPTNDPDTSPTGWTWLIAERLTQSSRDRIVEVPHDAAGGILQLADIADALPGPAVVTYALQTALLVEEAARIAADLLKANATDAVITASAVGARALIVRALPGATPPSGAIAQVKDHTGAVLAEVTAGSVNLNVAPATYSAVITGVRMYLGAADPDPGAANGSIWGDTSTGHVVWKLRVGGAWVV